MADNNSPDFISDDQMASQDNSDQPLEQQFNQENPVGSQLTNLVGSGIQKSMQEDTEAYRKAVAAHKTGDEAPMQKWAADKGAQSAMAAIGEAGKLDMMPEARMARAEKMGFDTSKTYYHGTPNDIKAFDPNKSLSADVAGFFTQDPKFADEFTPGLHQNRLGSGGGNIVPVHLSVKNTFDGREAHLNSVMKNMSSDDIEQVIADMPYINGKEMSKKQIEQQLSLLNWQLLERPEILNAIKKSSFDSMHVYENGKQNIAVFNPENIRSKFATFDPKKKTSGNISYATGGPVNMADGGNVGAPDFIPDAQMSAMTNEPQQTPQQGLASAPDFIPDDQFVSDEDKYGSLGQQAIAGAEAIGQGIAGPLAPLAEKTLGIDPEAIRGRQEANPITHVAGQVAGLVGGPFGKALSVIGAAGKAGAAALGLGKIGSAVASNALEMAAFQASDEASKMVLNDPNQTVDSALTNMGLAAATGGGLGLTGVAAKGLWKATMGGKTGGILKAIADKAGGIDGVPSDTETAIAQSGMDIAPELRAGLSNDPNMQQMFKTLQQSDTTSSGKALQETYQNFRKQAADGIVSALGKTADDLPALSDMSKYESGKAVGNALADEYASQVSPITKAFEDLKTKFQDVELQKPIIDDMADKISTIAQREGWTISPSSDIMHEVNRVIKELPNVKNLKNLGDYITQVGNNTAKDLMNRPLMRAGQMMKSVLKDTEADAITGALGAKEGPEAVAGYQAARDAYRQQSALRDALNDRLHVGGSTSGFAKTIREMAQTDGEALIRRLSGSGDADLLSLINKTYPNTANLIRDYHINSLLKAGVDKAAPDFSINSNSVLKAMNKMSPELRNFAVPPQSQAKLNAINHILDAFNKLPHNFSNTARTADKLFQHIPGTAVGMITALASHNPLLGVVVAPLVKTLGKDAPDAARLALLKYLGMPKPVDAAAFKESFDLIHNAIKGQELINKSVKNVFKPGVDVLPDSALPTEKTRKQIDEAIDHLQEKPENLIKLGDKVAYYMPQHGTAMTASTSNVLQFVRSQRPVAASQLPLDPKFEINKCDKAAYNQLLDLAEQPLIVLNKMKDGTLTAQDVMACSQMYPNLYSKLQSKLLEEMVNHKVDAKLIPYATKVGLSVFLGQPVDATMAQPAIMQIQNILSPPQSATPPPSEGKPKSNQRVTGDAFKKLPSMYQTPMQTHTARHMK